MSKRPDFHPLSLKQLAEKYGKKPRKRPVQRERAECFAFYDWYLINRRRFKVPTMIVHVANQGLYAGSTRQRQAFAANLKRMGKVPGALDYVCTPAGLPGFWIEFKDGDGELSGNQEAFIATLDEMGIEHFLVRGWEAAVQVLVDKGIF
jgi:hypothetical protein